MASADVSPANPDIVATPFFSSPSPPAASSSPSASTATLKPNAPSVPVSAPVPVPVSTPAEFINSSPSPSDSPPQENAERQEERQSEKAQPSQLQQLQQLQERQHHTHRQNHNSSKLPTFRLADLKDLNRESLVLPCRLQQMPPTPVSPNAAQLSSESARLDQPWDKSPEEPVTAESVGNSAITIPATTATASCNSAGGAEAAESTNNPAAASATNSDSGLASPARTRPSTFQDSTLLLQQQQQPPPAQNTSSSSSSTAVTATTSTTTSATNTGRSSIASIISTSITPPKRPASFPNSPPKVFVSAANTTPTTVSSEPTPARLQRTLTDPSPSRPSALASATDTQSSHRRAPASFSSNGRETSHGPPAALSAKRLQAVNIQAAAAASAPASTSSSAQPPEPTSAGGSVSSSVPASPAVSDTKSQRELILPKAVQEELSADDKRKTVSRPPVSFRRPRNDSTASSRAVIPPIRSFRSSGSRKSLGLDMNFRSSGIFDDADHMDGGVHDPHQRDRTLRALEGRPDDDFAHITPPHSGGMPPESENTADLFMRIARDDSRNRSSEDERPSDSQSAVSRATRVSQRRPFSGSVATHQTTSPPQVTRRFSDQRDTVRHRRLGAEPTTQQQTSSREVTQRVVARERPGPIRTSFSQKPDSATRSRFGGNTSKASPSTPRTSVMFDTQSEVGPSYPSRRPSVPDNSSVILPARTSSIKASHSYARTYNSSPLVPKHVDIAPAPAPAPVPAPAPAPALKQDAHDAGHGAVEGTESSASTAAPSTVWDELDDLKSRMRRLELSGKIPPTAGAAMSRVSDDRPATATTNATTISASPKRGSNSAQTEARSTTSSQRQQQLLTLQKEGLPSQSILLSAVQKARPHTSDEVFRAIETIATEALTLSHMVGVAGQPGPISSGASSIGTGGPSTVTDRQLRRKAESICRSLTEMCLALNEEAAQAKAAATTAAAVASVTAQVQQAAVPREEPVAALASPTVATSSSKTFSSLASSRRAAAAAEAAAMPPLSLSSMPTSPRALGRYDERRPSLLTTPVLPSPRHGLGPPVSSENAGRKSSLLIARTRRAVSEEPEDSPTSGRRSSMLRMRRAATEEPEDGRRSSMLLRTRRTVTLAEPEEEETRPRPPSRANTELSTAVPRTAHREHQSRDHHHQSPQQATNTSPLASSALPRRRLVPSSLNSRLVTPQTTTTAVTAASSSLLAGRRFVDRITSDRESSSMAAVDKHIEDRLPAHRQLSFHQASSVLARSGTRRLTRESALPSLSSTTSQVGGYR